MADGVLSQQCTATSKRSGNRCRRLVRGGGVCVMHGGAAPQVRVRRESRILEQRARLAGEDWEDRPAHEVLASAMADADAMLARVKGQIRTGQVDAATLDALTRAIDLAARISKTVVDAGIEERRQRLAEGQGALLANVIRAILGRLMLTAEQQELVPVVVPQELRRLGELEAGGSR